MRTRLRPLAVALIAAFALTACSSGPSAERIDLTATTIAHTPASPSVLEVVFEVTNPRQASLETVTCTPYAYVGSSDVSRFLSGGSISDLGAGETRRVRTSVEIKEQQAVYVSRVEMRCSSRVAVTD